MAVHEAESVVASYLYGIIEGTGKAAFGVPGMEGDGPVHTVAHNGLGCLVSHYRGEDFRSMGREKLVRSLLAHQKVVECVMGERTVLPVKFGTILNDHLEVQQLLAQGHRELTDAMNGIRDKVEMEVAATWDIRRVLAEVGQQEEVARARQALLHLGQATTEQRVQLGQMVKAGMDRKRKSYRDRMAGLLRPLAIDMAPNALLSDEMVMNVAFLIERGRVGQLCAGVERLDQLFQNEVSFRIIGPLPPYSFSTVGVTRLTTEQVAEARQTLHLGGDISEAEVKNVYRRLSAGMHRQLLSGDRLATEQFTRLRQAAQVLLGCCRARGGEGATASLGHSIESLFLIAIGGPSGEDIEPSRFGVLDEAQAV